MGYEAIGGRPVPLIDQIHRLMSLWKAGEVAEVDDYIDSRGLRRSELFKTILQAIIELAEAGSEERSLLESISNYVASGTRGTGGRRSGAGEVVQTSMSLDES
jgi:putative DNA methylase